MIRFWNKVKAWLRGATPFPFVASGSMTISLPLLTPEQGTVSYTVRNPFPSTLTIIPQQPICICHGDDKSSPVRFSIVCPYCDEEPATINGMSVLVLKHNQGIRLQSRGKNWEAIPCESPTPTTLEGEWFSLRKRLKR